MAAPQPSRHALAGPSKAYQWVPCPGSIAMAVRGAYPNKSSENAAVGTFQHHVAATALTEGKNAADYLGYKETVDGYDFTFDADHASTVQTYLDTVRLYAGVDGDLYVECELDISWITGEEGAIGTADAVIVNGDQITVVDLKTGRNKVTAEKNSQLTIYAMAAKRALELGLLGNPVRNTPPPVETPEDDGSDLC